jgi:proteasome lid subunit RPN8/RPN11
MEYAMIALTKKTKHRKHKSTQRPRRSLRFTPYAMAKLLYLRDIGPTEVGGFGISNAEDLLLIEDIQLVEQICTAVSVEFNDDSVADYFDRQVDAGRQPEQFARIWIHTHPGASPSPSGTDEETFQRVFGGVDWAVMHILAEEGNTYTRARFNVGPGTQRRLRCGIDYSHQFPAANHDEWFADYCQNVTIDEPFSAVGRCETDFELEDWWERSPSTQTGVNQLECRS